MPVDTPNQRQRCIYTQEEPFGKEFTAMLAVVMCRLDVTWSQSRAHDTRRTVAFSTDCNVPSRD